MFVTKGQLRQHLIINLFTFWKNSIVRERLIEMTSYTGYNSYQSNRSQTEQYNMENFANNHYYKQQQQQYNLNDQCQQQQQQQNPQNLTYQESSHVEHFQPLYDITNKIKISHALITENKSTHLSLFRNVQYPKIYFKTQANEQDGQCEYQYQYEQCRPKQQIPKKKSRAYSLIYFQERSYNKIGNQNCNRKTLKKDNINIATIENNRQNYRENINLPLQCPQIINKSSNLNKSINKFSISPAKYFAKNQPNLNQSPKQQVTLTSRSGYVLSISEAFLQNLNKQYNNSSISGEEISLKQKIKRKIQQGKKEQFRNLKTQADQRRLENNVHKKQVSKIYNYKPLQQQSKAISSRAMLCLQSFHQRQNKTLENKKIRIEKLKKQKVSSELKQCTFKPKTNNFNKLSLI